MHRHFKKVSDALEKAFKQTLEEETASICRFGHSTAIAPFYDRVVKATFDLLEEENNKVDLSALITSVLLEKYADVELKPDNPPMIYLKGDFEKFSKDLQEALDDYLGKYIELVPTPEEGENDTKQG